MRYILAEGEGQGEFFGHVYKCKGKMYRHQSLLFEIEETDTGWKDTGPFLKPTTVTEPLIYVGGLYAWCNRDLEVNTLPFKKLPKALKAAFNSFKLVHLEYKIDGDWQPCLIRPMHNLIVRLRKQWNTVFCDSGVWKFEENGTRFLQDYLHRDIIYTKHSKFYLKQRADWFLVENKEGFPIIQPIQALHFSIYPLIPIFASK